MTREQIEKAADRYQFQRLCDDRIQDLELESVIGGSFMDGAQWRVNSVWHDKSDFPEIGRKVLVAFVDGFYVVWDVKPETKLSFIHFNIKMWCYIDDLLPDVAPAKKEIKDEHNLHPRLIELL